MIRVFPNLPDGCDVSGHIYWDDNPRVMGEDMLDVLLPNGILISCGWYPEGNPAGSYRITASEGFDERRRVETKSVTEARMIVEQLCRLFSSSAFFLSESASSRFTVYC